MLSSGSTFECKIEEISFVDIIELSDKGGISVLKNQVELNKEKISENCFIGVIDIK